MRYIYIYLELFNVKHRLNNSFCNTININFVNININFKNLPGFSLIKKENYNLDFFKLIFIFFLFL